METAFTTLDTGITPAEQSKDEQTGGFDQDISKRGFGTMVREDPDRQRRISAKGGRSRAEHAAKK